ncbi:MAG: TlpA family protein disulfide reductase [Gemmatimonadaceae bacterium]|nr:TlpA family protein disulfide reductase [Gemmatimonadaceae bacterium]
MLLLVLLPVPSRLRAQAVPAESGSGALSWQLLTPDGRPASLAGLRGRVIVVNSWATWCEPCVAELASFRALRRAIPDSGLAFAMIAPQRAAPVQAFVRRRAPGLPVYLEAAPPPAVYGFEMVPTTWIIDRSGRIVERHRGAADWNTAPVRARLRALLAATPAR